VFRRRSTTHWRRQPRQSDSRVRTIVPIGRSRDCSTKRSTMAKWM
jgi:hypothetical protein